MAQNNIYELTYSDGKTTKITTNSFRDAQRMVETFKMDVIKMQRIYNNGKRSKLHTF